MDLGLFASGKEQPQPGTPASVVQFSFIILADPEREDNSPSIAELDVISTFY